MRTQPVEKNKMNTKEKLTQCQEQDKKKSQKKGRVCLINHRHTFLDPKVSFKISLGWKKNIFKSVR